MKYFEVNYRFVEFLFSNENSKTSICIINFQLGTWFHKNDVVDSWTFFDV